MRVNTDSTSKAPHAPQPPASNDTALKAAGAALSVLQQGAQVKETQMSDPKSTEMKGRAKDLTGTEQRLTSLIHKDNT